MDYAKKLIDLAGAALSAEEADLCIAMLNQALKPDGGRNRPALDVLQLVKADERSAGFKSMALYINRRTRELSLGASPAHRAPLVRSLVFLREKLAAGRLPAPAGDVAATEAADAPGDRLADAIIKVYRISVGRSPVAEEIDIWKSNFANGLPFHEFLLQMGASPEAAQHARRQALMPGSSDGAFVQTSYELVLGRGAAAWEIEAWRRKLEEGSVTRPEMLANLFGIADQFFTAQANAAPHDGLSCLVMGTGRHLSAAQWQAQAKAMAEAPPKPADTRYANRFHVKGEPRVLVSALASMYRGGDFIEQFMDNITGQDGFDDFCELVIVDAESPEDEYKTIKRYLKNHKSINYIRCNYRIGIYDAWNVAAKAARGLYLTNTNMDDLRRNDSLLQQAAVLENLPFVDVVYQDLYYTFDPRLSCEEIAAFGHETTLPVITAHNMIQFNSPHNAPMWRKRLHEELGWFDTHYKSAGDYEFWMRCMAAGKKFYKINDPHVVYYQNPKGLSTRPDSRGVIESMEIHRAYCRKLVPQDVIVPREEFIRALDPAVATGRVGDGKDRYMLAQEALRNLARFGKYGTPQGGQAMIRLLVDGVFYQLANTGIARVWRSVLELLVASGRFDIYFLDRGNAPAIAGITYIPFPTYLAAYCPADSQLIQDVCGLYEIDVFSSTYLSTPLSTPMLMMVHDMIPELFDFDMSARGWLEKATAICYAQRYICVSENTRNDLLAIYPEIPPDRVAMAHNGVDTAVFRLRNAAEIDAFRQRYGLDRPYFLFVGSRLQHTGYKNSRLFFDALAGMDEASFDVFCVGGEREIEHEISGRLPPGVRCRRVELTDDELALAYGGGLALVYPSLYEGFGLPVVEAMASGCPVITTHHGSLAEVAADAAMLISGTSKDEMRDALVQMQDPAVRDALRRKGLVRAGEFRWQGMADAVAANLELLAAEAATGMYDSFFAEWKRRRLIQANVDFLQP